MPGLRRWLAAVVLFAMMTAATFLWYRDERGYIDQRGIPVRLPAAGLAGAESCSRAVLAEQPRLPKTFTIGPDVTHVMGGYWDVYKLAFLSGGRLVGVPFPIYPNRFPGWSRGLGPGRGKLLDLESGSHREKAGFDRECGNGDAGSSDRARRSTGSQASGPYGNRTGAIPPS